MNRIKQFFLWLYGAFLCPLPRAMFYKLEGSRITPMDSWAEWFSWYDCHERDRKIALFSIEALQETVEISTVFMGLDHNPFRRGKPLLFETLITGGLWHTEKFRTATYEEAMEVHARMVDVHMKIASEDKQVTVDSKESK